MRIITQVITVIATSILLVSAIWSIVIFTSPYESEFVYSLDEANNEEKESTVDTQLYGSWENIYQSVHFGSNGSFDNQIYIDQVKGDEEPILLNNVLRASYGATEEELEFYDAAEIGTNVLFDYYLENNGNELYIVNGTHSFILSRNINAIRSYGDIVNYSDEKVNITGNLVVENETNGYLTINGSNTKVEVLIFFGDYNETNVTEFDGQNVSIIGYLCITCDCDYWEGPCIKDIELIELTN